MSCDNPVWETTRWNNSNKSVWPESFPKPRTCSFCGGVHPDDLMTLIDQGWEFEPTGKSYKSYWHPPGYSAYMEEVLKNIGEGRDTAAGAHPEPSPPVKLYSQHVDAEMAAKINTKLLLRRVSKCPNGS